MHEMTLKQFSSHLTQVTHSLTAQILPTKHNLTVENRRDDGGDGGGGSSQLFSLLFLSLSLKKVDVEKRRRRNTCTHTTRPVEYFFSSW